MDVPLNILLLPPPKIKLFPLASKNSPTDSNPALEPKGVKLEVTVLIPFLAPIRPYLSIIQFSATEAKAKSSLTGESCVLTHLNPGAVIAKFCNS